MKPRVAIIGLGIMARGMAHNFLKNNYEVTVWNRTEARSDELVAEGAVKSASVSEAVRTADVIFEVTANDESSRKMWLGQQGIIANARPDQILIASSTLSAEWTDELAAQCKKMNLTFFDIPLTGGRVAAESGNLTMLVGGDKTKLDQLRSTLSAVATNIKYFGKAGSGMRYKLVLNALQAIHIAGFGEAMRLAVAAGLNPADVGPALCERPGGVVTNIAWESYQRQPEPITFSVDWITKDLDYASRLSDNAHPQLDDVLDAYRTAIANGDGQSDWTKIIL